MIPVNFPGVTKTLTKPPGMSEDQCGPLPIYHRGNVCTSCWKMSFRELLKVIVTRRIYVLVMSGETQPPICVSTKVEPF